MVGSHGGGGVRSRDIGSQEAERETDAGAQLAVSCVFSSWTHGMELPKFRLDILTSVSPV